MPRHVDEAARLQEIAQAVLRIVAHEGLDAVTFRSVASALGSSTTVVTHFVPDRDSLLERAFEVLRADLAARIDAALAEAHLRAKLRIQRRWSCCGGTSLRPGDAARCHGQNVWMGTQAGTPSYDTPGGATSCVGASSGTSSPRRRTCAFVYTDTPCMLPTDDAVGRATMV